MFRSRHLNQKKEENLYMKKQEYRRDVPFWVEGELWIGGDGVGTYRGDEELVRQKFVEDSGTVWYRTGDKGRFWEDGTIEFLGREDFQVKIRGHRIELGEIETSIKSIDGIDESIVISNKGKLIAFFYSKGSEINDQKRFLIDNEEYITDELEKVLDDLGIIIIVDILIYEKCFIENGLYYTYNDLCKICKIDTHYKKLFGIWLNMLRIRRRKRSSLILLRRMPIMTLWSILSKKPLMSPSTNHLHRVKRF